MRRFWVWARSVGFGAAIVGFCGFVGCTFTVDTGPLSDGICPPGKKRCDVAGKATCVPTDDPKTGCNSPRCDSCGTQGWSHAQTKCDAQGQCAVLTCESNWGDCKGGNDGCETSLQVSDDNCGICGISCKLPVRPNATSRCVNGKCQIGSSDCDPGYVDCDGIENNGCECPPSKTCNLATKICM